jgi:hypothetical protein
MADVPLSPVCVTGRCLELQVTAKHSDAGDWLQFRDVYLSERDPKDAGARSAFLYNVDCPEAVTRRLVAWAESLGIPVVCYPPGNLVPGWSWPKEETQPAAAVKPDPALDWEN